MTARLSNERFNKEIRDLKPGESGWTTPWAMSVTHDGGCYLNDRYTVHEHPGGTVQMIVSRDPDGDYSVDITEVTDYKWSKSAYVPDSSWFSIPVEHIDG